MISLTADSSRHLRTLWRGEECWQWAALYYGHEQPRGYRTYWKSRLHWKLHLTPIHASRDSSGWTLGLCWGRRTLLVYRHR